MAGSESAEAMVPMGISVLVPTFGMLCRYGSGLRACFHGKDGSGKKRTCKLPCLDESRTLRHREALCKHRATSCIQPLDGVVLAEVMR